MSNQGETEKIQLAWNGGIKQNRIIKTVEYIFQTPIILRVKGDTEYRQILYNFLTYVLTSK